MTVQLYGQVHDHLSLSNVTRGIAHTLKLRRMPATIYGTSYLGSETGPKTGYVNPFLQVGFNNSADVGIFVGYPPGSQGWLSGHAYKILVTVCETDKIPTDWVDACNQADLVVVPSSWCKDAFLESKVKVPVIVARHGVWTYALPKPRPTLEHTNILHVSGSLTFAARKGTTALLSAWRQFIRTYPHYRLWLKMPRTEGVAMVIDKLDIGHSVQMLEDEPYEPERMVRLYQAVDAVCQPSRAEGFGLVPLEARMVGTPCIITSCTGHAEHFNERLDVEIKTSNTRALLMTQGNDVGKAPMMSVDAVLKGLLEFAARKDYYQNSHATWSLTHKYQWLWDVTLEPLMSAIKENMPKRSRIKLGAAASLRGAQ